MLSLLGFPENKIKKIAQKEFLELSLITHIEKI